MTDRAGGKGPAGGTTMAGLPGKSASSAELRTHSLAPCGAGFSVPLLSLRF
jgi:hypothetical protein